MTPLGGCSESMTALRQKEKCRDVASNVSIPTISLDQIPPSGINTGFMPPNPFPAGGKSVALRRKGIKTAKRDNTELVRALILGESSNYAAWRTQ